MSRAEWANLFPVSDLTATEFHPRFTRTRFAPFRRLFKRNSGSLDRDKGLFKIRLHEEDISMKWRSRCSARPIAAACLVILVFIFEGVAILFPARAQEDRVLGNETGKIIYDKSIPGIRSAAVVVPEFTAQRLQETAAHFVDSVRGATLAELLIGSDENELTVSERGTVPRPESE